MTEDRHMTPFEALFLRDAALERVKIESVEGVMEPEGLYLKVLMVTEAMLVFKAWKMKGITDP